MSGSREVRRAGAGAAIWPWSGGALVPIGFYVPPELSKHPRHFTTGKRLAGAIRWRTIVRIGEHGSRQFLQPPIATTALYVI